METIIKHKLKVGLDVEKEFLDNIQLESEKQTALNKAVKYISKTMKTQKQVVDYLKGKGYVFQVINFVLEKLKEYNFVDDETKTLRVATKFSNIAKDYYNKKCRDIDVIHLNGSIEIAPILGLSDVIVDIVETGKTLLENDLIPFETIVPISARLIANKSSFGFKGERISEIKSGILSQVKYD